MDKGPGERISGPARNDSDRKSGHRFAPIDSIKETVQNFVNQTVAGYRNLFK
jgi:hypothetical protein